VTKIQRTIEINRKPEDVFSVLTDLHQLPHWATTGVKAHDNQFATGCRSDRRFAWPVALSSEIARWPISAIRITLPLRQPPLVAIN